MKHLQKPKAQIFIQSAFIYLLVWHHVSHPHKSIKPKYDILLFKLKNGFLQNIIAKKPL